jgi:CxxC-x17-CxxC domain-containing protein
MRRFERRDDFKSSSGRPHGSNRFGRRDTASSSPEFSRKDPGRGGHRGTSLEMFEITCDKCGKKSEVPFKPSGGKPVYCRDCFKREDSSSSRGKFREDFGPKERFERPERSDHSTDDIEKINRKLDKIMKALKIE